MISVQHSLVLYLSLLMLGVVISQLTNQLQYGDDSPLMRIVLLTFLLGLPRNSVIG